MYHVALLTFLKYTKYFTPKFISLTHRKAQYFIFLTIASFCNGLNIATVSTNMARLGFGFCKKKFVFGPCKIFCFLK